MPKQFKALKTPAPENLSAGSVDWERCFLCQSIEVTGLIHPYLNPSKTNDVPLGFKSLSLALEGLRQYQTYVLPSNLPISSLDTENIGLCESFVKNCGKYHKSCYAQYFGEKLARILKKCQEKKLEIQSKENDNEKRTTRASLPLVDLKRDVCFICDEPENTKHILHRVETKSLNSSVARCAEVLQDKKLIAVLSAGDLVAQEAKYHKNCITNLFNKCREFQGTRNTANTLCESLAFAELIAYLKGKIENESIEYIFKMPEIISMYHTRLSELIGVSAESIPLPHSSRFRSKVLLYLPELKEIKSGREYILVRNSANLHHEVMPEDFDGDAIAFHRFVKNLRKEISENPISFKGNLENPAEAIPSALLAVVETILYGTALSSTKKPALTISQLIVYNFHKTKPQSSPNSDHSRHSKSFEPTLPLHLGLSLYSHSRSKQLTDHLHGLGISISSNRVMEITSTLCKLVVERAKEEKVVCPPNLKKGVFTVAAIDNVDHNPSSTTSRGSFHGTSISLFQLVKSETEGETRLFSTNYKDVDTPGYRGVPMLPESTMSDTMEGEINWLEHVSNCVTGGNGDAENISWSAFHASEQTVSHCPSINALLPLFHENASSASMIYHGMTIIKETTEYLNPGQIPVLYGDQPLFTHGKMLQYNCPELSEEKFVMMFGHFHIEQNFLQLIGKFMKGGGWVGVAVNSGIIDVGSAEAIQTHVTKSRLMHEITCAVLYTLLHEAYDDLQPDHAVTFDDFLTEMAAKSPTFKYWVTLFNLEIILLNFVRSIRGEDYNLFKTTLKQMMPWFHIFDHKNYARWVAVHLKDLEELPEKAPSVHQEFCAGNFVVHKTGNAFSGLAIDQAHEQHNAMVKGEAGAIGLTQDPTSLRRFSVSGPEVGFMLSQYEGSRPLSQLMKHHEQYPSFQRAFLENCVALKESFSHFGNPFLEEGKELLALDTRIATIPKAVETLYSLETLGEETYKLFIKERFVEGAISVQATLKNFGVKIFEAKEKKDTDVSHLKNDLQLFSRLFIVARERDLDLDTFFQHENNKFPPSISTASGNLKSGKKSDLMEKLEAQPTTVSIFNNSCDAIVFDGAAVVQMIRPKNSKTFEDYYSVDLKPYVLGNARRANCPRIDLVWDMYLPQSLKAQERDSRGRGVRRNVVPNGVLPKDWSDFLRNDRNKTELFQFLGRRFIEDISEVNVVTNIGGALRSTDSECSSLEGQTVHMEEADGRILLHVKDGVEHGAKVVVVRSSDTDVLVISISFFHQLKLSGLQELWFLTGTGQKRRYIAVHKVAEKLGEEKSVALRGFHAYTGSDTTAYFSGKGKKTCLNTWLQNPEVTTAFLALSSPSNELDEKIYQLLEVFVCRLYDPTSEARQASIVRRDLFSNKNRLVQFIPPAPPSLRQKALRSAYQAGHLWGNSLSVEPLWLQIKVWDHEMCMQKERSPLHTPVLQLQGKM
ncbi:hypothetical protein FOCC_FOCC012580 [Frankliniella occidentalis]|nr:hypothetical protein FOCC_FOCC012580 [Frankliniella occidentalis]